MNTMDCLLEGHFPNTSFSWEREPAEIPPAQPFLSDISALTYNYRYEYKKLNQHLNYSFTQDIDLEIYVSYNGTD